MASSEWLDLRMSKSLFKSTSLVSFMTFLSRILGLIRDILVAQLYGATASVDAFYVAFKIPNFMRNLFAEGCFSQAFVPVLAEYKHQKTQQEIKAFISYIMGSLGLVLLLLTLFGIIAAPLWVKVFAPGYYTGTLRSILAINMLRITFPYLMLISLTAMAGAILNSYRQFGSPAFTPVLLNLCLIAAALWLSPFFKIPVEAQAWGILIAGFIQLGFQLPFLARLGLLVRPQINWQDEGVKKVLKLMIPALFGASIGQLSLLLNTIFASFLAVGSVSWLYYSERLAYFPLGVIGVALTTVVLPHLSTSHVQKSPAVFASTLDWGIRCNLLIGIPAAVALMVLAQPLIISLFHYGKFNSHDVIMTHQSVLAYAFGLVAFMLVKILSAGFYATQDIRTPVRLGIIAITINMLLNAILVGPLAHAGLALAASLAAWINTGLLLIKLYQRKVFQFQIGLKLFIVRLVIANSIMGIALWYVQGSSTQWLSWHWQQRILHVSYLGMLAIAIYIISLGLAGMRFKDLRVNNSFQ